MFIKSLTIKNFRCFGKEGITVNFNDEDWVTAFIGRNGSGKTAILEALNFLFTSEYLLTKIDEKDFHKDAKTTKEEDAIIIEGVTNKPFYIDIDVISNKEVPATVIVPCNRIRLFIKRREKAEKILDDPFRIEKTAIPILGDIDESIYQNQDFKKAYKIISLSEIDSVINDLDSAKEIIKNLLKNLTINVEKIDKFYKVKFRLRNSNEIREAIFPNYSLILSSNRRVKGLPKSYYLSKDRDDEVYGNYSFVAKILTDLHWKYKKKEISSENNILNEYETFAESLRNIIDEKKLLINKINEKVKAVCGDEKDFKIDFIDMNQPYKSAFIAKKEGEKILLPKNLGSGFNILIAYALFTYVADQEKIPIVLIIDEPELHLHSDWQRRMYEVFTKQTNLQFVYSTQSENFISLKNWSQIRLVSNFQVFPKERILHEEITATDGKIGTRADYLDDYSKKNLHISAILRENLELFFTKKCILVEGPSEKYAIPKLLNLIGCNFENYSVSIIPAWGKTKIKNYQMICAAFGIDYFTIYDEDIKEKDDSKTEMENIIQNKNENEAIKNGALKEKFSKFSTSFEVKLGVTGEHKFQNLVEKIEKLSNEEELDQEIKDCLNNLKKFIEN
jgi:predicted ATP-dependent endonuclease of OLD family